jgi:hypothetical protein
LYSASLSPLSREIWLTFSEHRMGNKLRERGVWGGLYNILGHVDFSDQCFGEVDAGSEELFSIEALQRTFSYDGSWVFYR